MAKSMLVFDSNEEADPTAQHEATHAWTEFSTMCCVRDLKRETDTGCVPLPAHRAQQGIAYNEFSIVYEAPHEATRGTDA